MKNLVLTITLFTSTLLSAQNFEGIITSKMEYDLPEAMEAQRSMLPSEMVMYIGKNFSRIEQKTMMGDQIVISNFDDKSAILLMNMMGKMMAIKMDSNGEEEDSTPAPEIKYTEETKEIAGYNCKKAIVITTDENEEELETEVYYTEEIPAKANDKVKGLKGFPLEYTISSQGMTITVTATNVEKKKVSKKLAEIPEGYEIMTMEEFQKMMGGGN